MNNAFGRIGNPAYVRALVTYVLPPSWTVTSFSFRFYRSAVYFRHMMYRPEIDDLRSMPIHFRFVDPQTTNKPEVYSERETKMADGR